MITSFINSIKKSCENFVYLSEIVPYDKYLCGHLIFERTNQKIVN